MSDMPMHEATNPSTVDPPTNERLLAEIEELRRIIADQKKFLATTPDTATPNPEPSRTQPPVEAAVVTETKISNVARRPRPVLSDPILFDGTKSQWRGWKLEMEGKLIVDGRALGEDMSQLRYVYSRLSGKARENVTTYVELATTYGGRKPQELLYRLDLLYGEKDRKQRAVNNLHTIQQGEFESFASFYPRFEREIANANAEGWPSESKIAYLQNALNDSMKQQLISASAADLADYDSLCQKCDGLSSRMDLLGQWKSKKKSDKGPRAAPKDKELRPQSPGPRREDMMEWEPTPVAPTSSRSSASPNVNGYASKRPEDQPLLGKRAKWVELDEMNARKRDQRCLRCGRDNCRISRCPLAAAIPPHLRNAAAKPRTRPAVTKAEVDEEDATDESGKE